MKETQQNEMKGEEKERLFSAWDCGSPLYDSFELASLYHVLERHLMALPFARAMSARSESVAMFNMTEEAPARRKGWRERKAAAKRRSKVVLHAVYRALTRWRKS